MEHIEKAGVHSGDSMAVYPPISIADKHIARARNKILKNKKK